MKETVEQGTVFKKEIPEILVNGKNIMTMRNVNQFKRHTGRAFHGIKRNPSPQD